MSMSKSSLTNRDDYFHGHNIWPKKNKNKQMKRIIIFFAFLIPLISIAQKDKLPLVIAPKFKKDSVNIKTFGAIADGNFLNTKSINAAIDALAKSGGGVVLIPSGLWLSGPVVLKSNINLHLATGATLLFTVQLVLSNLQV